MVRPPVAGRGIVVYVLVAYAGLWLATIPFWISPLGLALPGATVIIAVGMFSPTLASVLACRVDRRPWRASVGLAVRPVLRLIGCALGAVGVIAVATVAATLVAPLVGFRLDLAGVERLGLPVPAPVLLVVLVLQAVVAAFTVNGVLALGEEIGWRGYLLTALRPLGRTPAVIVSGLVWAGWHLPLVLLGYEFTGQPRPLAMIVFTVFTLVFGAGLSWLRWHSGSVLPGAVAHGLLNAVATITPLLLTGPALLLPPAGLLGAAAFLLAVVLLYARRPLPR